MEYSDKSSSEKKKLKNLQDLRQILSNIDLLEYYDILIKNKLADIDILTELTENDYENIGINELGARKN
jgi:hypothetical protein